MTHFQGGPSTTGPNLSPGSLPPSPGLPNYMPYGATNSPQQMMGPPPASLAPPAGAEYSFLINDSPTQEERTLIVSQELRNAVEAMRPIWMGKSQSKTNKMWLPVSATKKCVESRVTRVSKHAAHEDPEDPKTACPRCVRLKIPCIMAYPNHLPAVLLLPAYSSALLPRRSILSSHRLLRRN